MIIRILSIMLIFPTLCLSAEQFSLVENDSGETTAPITFTNGAQVTIGPKVYTLKMSEDKITQTESRMRTIILPAVEFREAAIPDVINFLVEMGKGGINVPRINIVLNNNEPSRPSAITTISLQLSQVSLYDTLRIVCDKGDMAFHIDESGIIQVMPKETETK